MLTLISLLKTRLNPKNKNWDNLLNPIIDQASK